MIIGILAAIIVYFILLPSFWPAPTVELQLPDSAQLDRDAKITLTVSSWHANVQVTSVYLVIDYDNYLELGLPAGVHPISLFQEDKVKQFWNWPNRFTWPRHRRYEYILPLREMAAQGLSEPGIMQGHAHVLINYPHLFRYNRIYGLGYRSNPREYAEPFSITLTGDTP